MFKPYEDLGHLDVFRNAKEHEHRVAIVGVDPGYTVSKAGVVYSGNRALRNDPNNGGYARVWVKVNGTKQRIFVHQIVAATFVSEAARLAGRFSDIVVRHIDGNKNNNAAWNLCLGSRAENDKDFRESGVKMKRLGANLAREIYAMRQRGMKIREICAATGIGDSTVRDVTSGRRWSSITGAKKTSGIARKTVADTVEVMAQT